MKCTQWWKSHDPSLRKRLMRTVTLSLWCAVLLGVVYYFAVVYRVPERGSSTSSQGWVARSPEWHDVPIADVGAGEEYELLEQYSELVALDFLLPYDSLFPWRVVLREMASLEEEEEDDEVEMEEKVQPQKATTPSTPRTTYPQSTRQPGIVSDWDHLFRKYGERYGWDWWVLAAIAYQESHFRPEVVGAGGATGLMGIMPATGRRYGYSRAQLKQAETSLRIACMALRDFGRAFAHIPDREQRMKFTLASYNAGSAHVLDARRLAERDGLDPDQWDDVVEIYMGRLDEPKYYNDPLVRHGRANGDHTVRYVSEVFTRAHTYKNKEQQHATAE